MRQMQTGISAYESFFKMQLQHFVIICVKIAHFYSSGNLVFPGLIKSVFPEWGCFERSNEVRITERAVRLVLSLQHRPDAILNLGGLLVKRKQIYEAKFIHTS